jgi:hypothetical protein
LQAALDLGYLCLTPDKRARGKGQIVGGTQAALRRRRGSDQVPIPDLLIEAGRLGSGRNVQFLGQKAAATVVLSQGFAAAPAEGQEVHQLAMCILAQWIQFCLPIGAV